MRRARPARSDWRVPRVALCIPCGMGFRFCSWIRPSLGDSQMTSVLTAVCPECQAIYRIDPSRVPAGGLRARCTTCGAVMAIGLPAGPMEWTARPVDPAVLAASDAAAAWDWFADERSGGAMPAPADDPWDGVWGETTPASATPSASRPDVPDAHGAPRGPGSGRPLPPAIARRPRD